MDNSQQQLIQFLKDAQLYNDKPGTCNGCRYSQYAGFAGDQLHCALNKAMSFPVSDHGTCRFFEHTNMPQAKTVKRAGCGPDITMDFNEKEPLTVKHIGRPDLGANDI